MRLSVHVPFVLLRMCALLLQVWPRCWREPCAQRRAADLASSEAARAAGARALRHAEVANAALAGDVERLRAGRAASPAAAAAPAGPPPRRDAAAAAPAAGATLAASSAAAIRERDAVIEGLRAALAEASAAAAAARADAEGTVTRLRGALRDALRLPGASASAGDGGGPADLVAECVALCARVTAADAAAAAAADARAAARRSGERAVAAEEDLRRARGTVARLCEALDAEARPRRGGGGGDDGAGGMRNRIGGSGRGDSARAVELDWAPAHADERRRD